MTRAEFLAERKTGIGGSDIASVFSIGYGCPLRLFNDKRNVQPDFPREQSTAMALGTFLEPFFAEEYRKLTGRMVEVHADQQRHPDHEWAVVHVDRMVTDKHKGFGGIIEPGVLEIKSVGRGAFYKYKREGLPPDYILQLQHAMLVTQSEWGSFAIGCRDSGELLWWDQESDLGIWASIIERGGAFWATVENGPAPDKLEPDDRRCQRCEYRLSCHGDQLVQLEPESDYVTDESLGPLAAEYIERRELKAQAEELLEETKQELQTRMDKRSRVMAGGIKLMLSSYNKKAYTVKAHSETRLSVVGRKE